MLRFHPSFTVIHNGTTFLPGSPVEVSEKDAEALKNFGVIEAVGETAAGKGEKEQAKTNKKNKKAQAVEDDDIL